MTETYKERLIDPRAYELADGTGWTAEVYVAEDVGDETIDTQFFIKGIFPSRDAALNAALMTGRREVDKRDIHSVIADETQLPSTHRPGFGHRADDVAVGADGQPTKVPGPENPEDRFN